MVFSICFEKNMCCLEFFFFPGFVQFSYFMRIFAFELNINIKCFCALFQLLLGPRQTQTPSLLGHESTHWVEYFEHQIVYFDFDFFKKNFNLIFIFVLDSFMNLWT
jgi:hypothetical protein